MTTRTRRTPEQLAAYHQRKANQARAKAKKMAKDAKIRKQIELGKAAEAAGFSDPVELHAMAKLGRVLAVGIGKDGRFKIGESYHFAAAETFAEAHGNEIDAKTKEWWRESGLPMGPERA